MRAEHFVALRFTRLQRRAAAMVVDGSIRFEIGPPSFGCRNSLELLNVYL
jgi:hypothetical protein